MLKTGRKPSSDPVQEKLRQRKDLWNKGVRTFINDLINFKKTMNGSPSKFFPQKSNIKDPIPADPVSILTSLLGEFQELTQQGNAIISEQIDYSKTRKKPGVKAPKPAMAPAAPTPATPAAPDLTQQLAAWDQSYQLTAEGSNPITRFFTKLLTPTMGVSEAARIRKYRMSLLDACANTYKVLGKLQVEITKSSDESITNSNKIFHTVWNDWMLVHRGFNTYKSNMPSMVSNTGGEIKPPQNLEEEMKGSGDPNALVPGDYDHEPSDGGISKPPPQPVPVPVPVPDKSTDLDKKAPPKPAVEQLEVVSQAFLKKWIGKTRHQMSLLDKTSAYRLDIYKMATELRSTLNKMMDSLEKDMNIQELSGFTAEINKQMVALRGLMRALNATRPKAKGQQLVF
jgi:hypothetical protein